MTRSPRPRPKACGWEGVRRMVMISATAVWSLTKRKRKMFVSFTKLFAIPILWQIRQMPSTPAASAPNAIPPDKGELSAAASFRSKLSSAFYKIRCIKAWLPTAANNIPVSMPPLSTRYSLTWFRLFLPPTRRNVKPDALKCRLPAVNEKPRP